MMKFTMTENGFETETTFGQLTITGNEDYGFRPYQLLVSPIAFCSGGVFRNILEKMRMPAKYVTIEVKELLRNPDITNRLEKIHLHFTIKGTNMETSKIEKAFELTMKNYSMVQSVIESTDIVKTYEVIF